VITVAPVVVNPEVDSKIASVKERVLSGNIKKGIDPNKANVTQNIETIINPS
jgi:hypothetical protein